MPCKFEHLYPIRGNSDLPADTTLQQHLSKYFIQVGEGTVFSGLPRIAFSRVRDVENQQLAPSIRMTDFAGRIKIGENCYVESSDEPAFHSQSVKLTSVQINDRSPGEILIGDKVYLPGVAIVAYQRVEIGCNVRFGPMVTIMDSSGHPVRERGADGEATFIRSAPVKIEDHAWIGINSTILKGVTIGRNSVIGANSVVYESVPENSIALGNPARIVKDFSLERGFPSWKKFWRLRK